MNKYLVEFLGTLLLVTVIWVTGNYLAIGAALALAVYLGGTISGGAFNPAVALTMYSSGNILDSDIIPYIVAEILGAYVGLILYKQFFLNH